jgi:peptidyl-dipeptidase A
MNKCWTVSRLLMVALVVVICGCCPMKTPKYDNAPTLLEAERFMKQVEQQLLPLTIIQNQANWVRESFITDDTEALGSQANEVVMEFVGRKAAEAAAFNPLLVQMPFDLRRKMDILKTNLDMPAPKDTQKRQELAKISTSMDSLYGKGKYCSKRLNQCLDLEQISAQFAKNRDYDDLLDLWQGWHLVGRPMREKYQRFVELSNQASRELGYANLADVWNSRYDMPPALFEEELDRLWQQVQPLYRELHCYVRSRLTGLYGPQRVPPGKPIPMHLLGNLWA